MIRHIVLWRLREDTPDHQARWASEIKTAFEALNGRIPGMLHLEIGIDLSRSPESSDIALYAEFESMKAVEGYRDHPEHLALMPLIRAVRTERRVVDFPGSPCA